MARMRSGGCPHQILGRLVAIRGRVDLKLATAAALARLDLPDDDIVLQVQRLDALQLHWGGGQRGAWSCERQVA